MNNQPGKEELTRAFNALKKMGYIAKKNFSCCQSCAGYEIASTLGETIKKDSGKKSKVRGCVFYHHQDNAALKGSGELMLAYGVLGVDGVGDVGIPTVEQGKEIVRALEQEGCRVEWDGTEDTRICVHLPGCKVPQHNNRRW